MYKFFLKWTFSLISPQPLVRFTKVLDSFRSFRPADRNYDIRSAVRPTVAEQRTTGKFFLHFWPFDSWLITFLHISSQILAGIAFRSRRNVQPALVHNPEAKNPPPKILIFQQKHQGYSLGYIMGKKPKFSDFDKYGTKSIVWPKRALRRKRIENRTIGSSAMAVRIFF